MTNPIYLSLKILRKLFDRSAIEVSFPRILNADEASDYIRDLLNSEKGVMIGRFGSTELAAVTNYLGIKSGTHPFSYILGKQEAWWWNESIKRQMLEWSGFFPSNPGNLERFAELMLKDSSLLDLLGSWVPNEMKIYDYYSQADITLLRFLEPFWSSNPWTNALENKKVLIIHPFNKTIESQYQRREKLFKNSDMIPEFRTIETIKAVQSLGKGDERFKDWFDALQWMKDEIDARDYDVCLIGCGAYGFPLAAHVKRSGKKAIHLGGALQLLFGIRGKRWEDPNYGVKEWGIPVGAYSSMMNKYWVRPDDIDKPQSANCVEGGCYW